MEVPNLTGPLFTVVGVGALALIVPAAVLGMIFGFLTAWGLTRRLQRLARAAQAWSRGDFSVAVKDRSKDEIGQLSRELNQMAAQLENLIQTRQELATLEARNRFARDLHDSVKQQVFATSFQVAAARALLEKDAKAAEAHLTQAEELARQAQRELNVLIQEMRPAALEGKGLAAALRDYVRSWSRRAEIQVEVHIRGEREVPLEVEQALFRVAQEALANVARHSGAGNAEVDLIYTADSLTLRVTDNGRGFDPAKDPGEGFGLQSMHERLAGLGGRVEVESSPGKGTIITCSCPLESLASKRDKRS
jgi:NarL family two-component system sensor histidine kinase LiaS